MRSKLAIWIWILPIIAVVQNSIFSRLFSGVRAPTPLGIRMLFLFDALLIWAVLITGIIFGIAALVKIKRDSKLEGKVPAIIGIDDFE